MYLRMMSDTSAIPKRLFAYANLTEYLDTFRRTLAQMPDYLYNDIIIEIDYTKTTILQEFEQAAAEVMESVEEESANQYDVEAVQKKFRALLREKYTPLYNVLRTIVLMISVLAGLETLNNTLLPFFQNVYVMMEGKSDVFYINNAHPNGIHLYAEASCKADTVRLLYYGDEVTCTEDRKLWLKVTYCDEDGNVVEGWIAKRNLISYRDYLFNMNE